MKCPKCQYISFDSGNRCRNCGYEFSLTVEVEALDLPIQTGDEAIGPLGDLSLTDLDAPLAASPRREASSTYTAPNGGFPSRGPVPPPRAPTPVRVQPMAPASDAAPAPVRMPGTGSLELPLFNDRAFDDDRPLVTPPAVPRAPLSVRRSGPPVPRSQPRMSVEEPELDLELPSPEMQAPPVRRAARIPPEQSAPQPALVTEGVAAGAVSRLLAAIIDLLLLAAVDAAVLYFTLQLVGFRMAELALLPRVPLFGFMMLLNGGYFVTFTVAGGQTIGKMLTGIKVVTADADANVADRVPLGHAVLRTASYMVSVLPAGLGYLPALVSRDRRAIHDRLADTRVVKA